MTTRRGPQSLFDPELKKMAVRTPGTVGSRSSAAVVLLECGRAGSEDKSKLALEGAACFEACAQTFLYAAASQLLATVRYASGPGADTSLGLR